MRIILLHISIFLLCGCSTETIIEESAFQAVHTVDLVQSVNMNYRTTFESNNIQDGGWIIGNRPNHALMATYMLGEAVGHALVTYGLERYTSRWCVRGWELLTISMDSATVDHNYRIGMSVKF